MWKEKSDLLNGARKPEKGQSWSGLKLFDRLALRETSTEIKDG